MIFTDTHLVVWLLSLICIFIRGDANGVSVVESSFWPTLVHGMNETVCDVVSPRTTQTWPQPGETYPNPEASEVNSCPQDLLFISGNATYNNRHC